MFNLNHITMKKFYFAVLLLFSINVVMAQESNSEDVSKSETLEFLKKDGACYKKEFYDLGKIKGVECQVLIVTDVVQQSKIGCLRLKTKYMTTVSVDSYIGTLDYSEIDACIKSLEFIKSELQSQPPVYTEFEYKTNDGIKIGAYYDEGNKKKAPGWTAYIYTKGYTSRSAEFFDSSNIDSFIDVLNKSKLLIEEKVQ